jgi:hypothetical protein
MNVVKAAPTRPTRWKSSLLIVISLASMLVPFNLALAAPAAEKSGELSGDSTKGDKKSDPYVLQAADPDKPKDPSLVVVPPADATAKKTAKPKDEGPPIYQKWQFWAITGGILVGIVGAVFATTKILHTMHGGDVAGCPDSLYPLKCYGEGQ